MLLFSIINCTIEIGEILIEQFNLKTPLKYKEIFKILNNEKIIKNKTSNILSSFIYQRNMIANQYSEIKNDKIFEAISKRYIFQNFVDEILEYLKKK